MRVPALILALMFSAPANLVSADEPEVLEVKVSKLGMYWRVSVTLEHADTGWDHYADGWQIETEDGTIIGTRELMHPHVDEQPFTRSLSSVVFPDGTRRIYVRARCSHDGWSDHTYPVDLDLASN